MPRPSNWSILGAHTLTLSKNIHKVTKRDYVWFEFLWIRLYNKNLFKRFYDQLIIMNYYGKDINLQSDDKDTSAGNIDLLPCSDIY